MVQVSSQVDCRAAVSAPVSRNAAPLHAATHFLFFGSSIAKASGVCEKWKQ